MWICVVYQYQHRVCMHRIAWANTYILCTNWPAGQPAGERVMSQMDQRSGAEYRLLLGSRQ
jgi:hypothetical protein